MLYGYVNAIDIKGKKSSVSGHRSLYHKHSLYVLGGYNTATKKDQQYKVSRKESFRISMSNYDIDDVGLSLPSFYAMVDMDDYYLIHGGVYYKYENGKQKQTVSNSLHIFRWENDELVNAHVKISSDNSPKGLYYHQAAQLSDNIIVFFGGISEDKNDRNSDDNNSSDDSSDDDEQNNDNKNNNNHTYFLKLKYKGKSDEYELKKVKWVKKEFSTPQPCNRIGHSFVSHNPTQTCILYGGKDESNNVLSDMHILAYDDDDKYQWIEPIFPKPSLRLPPLYGHCMEEYNDDCYIIYGGETSYQGNVNNQIYILTMLKYPVNMDDELIFYVSVSKPLLSNAVPSPSLYSSMTVHKGNVYIFGGSLDESVLNDFYEYTLTDQLMEIEKPRESSLAIFLKQLNLYYLLDVFLSNKIKEKSDLDYISEEQYIEMGLKLGEYRLIMMNIGFIKKLDNCIVIDEKRIDLIVFTKNDIKKLKKDKKLGDKDSKIVIVESKIEGIKESSLLDKLKEMKEKVGNNKIDLKGFKAYNCVVCQEHLSKYAFIPCGHYGACEACCDQLKQKPVFKCPFCNHPNPDLVEVKLPPNDDDNDE